MTARRLRAFEEWYRGFLWEMQEERTEDAAKPDQPAGDQTKDVEVEEETTCSSTVPTLDENLYRDGGYGFVKRYCPNPPS